ncbi:uncharacterized protein Dwil_GK16128 [Drosophila willistoni]|uniref:Meckel syndrome type 1 protein n=1 Tax=Drosophila willistoni TaxID=7260 RepID=B4N2G2_DROWI|nr:uncharacterized protein Dwil_GK16128 [Drosophila willistoni]
MKRTGIYRIIGSMADFQLDIKLRHMSEWLPVPKFEYNGANPHAPHSDHYPVISPSPSPRQENGDNGDGQDNWSDCFIYVPYSDEFSYGMQGYYNYYNPGSGYPTSRASIGSNRAASSNSNSSNLSQRNSRKIKGRSRQPGDSTSVFSSQMEQVHEETEEEATGEDEQQELEEEQDQQPQSYRMDELKSNTTPQGANEVFYNLNKELCNGATANLRIGWQQKHFSRSELQRYGDPRNCFTPLQRRYHRWTQDIIELQQRHELAHSQAHEEPLEIRVRRKPRKSKRRRNAQATPTSSLSENAGLSSLPMSQISVQTIEDPNFAARTCLIHTLIDADGEEALPEEAHQLHAEGFQLMYVYAELQADTLLLTLKYSPSLGLLYVYPDFNFSADDLDYMIKINRDNDCSQLYAYGFQNVNPLESEFGSSTAVTTTTTTTTTTSSQQDDNLDVDLELPSDASTGRLIDHHQQQRDWANELRSLLHFELPPKRMRRISLMFELSEAQDFENANIHVRYYIQPPDNTILDSTNVEEPFPLRGATATCLQAGDQRLAHLSHCWQLNLLCEEQHNPEHLLHIYFEVISIDSWQRERCEGYAHYAFSLVTPLPLNPLAIRLQCMRPLGTWLDDMNRYFIGGRKLFDFVGYFNPNNLRLKGGLHNRLNADISQAMRSTGFLMLRLQKLQQRQPAEQQLNELLESDSETAEMGKASTLDEVMAAYTEARDRVELLLGRQ